MNEIPGFQRAQRDFTAYLRDPLRNPAPADIEPRRLQVYRELIYNNIEGFIAGAFPVLRSLITDADWRVIVETFVARHRSHSPYFLAISEEFLVFLSEDSSCLPGNLPFALELAHYEWIELALDISSETLPAAVASERDPLTAPLSLSPLAQLLCYQYPVHKISPSFRPSEAPVQPTCLVAYRNSRDEVKFLETNAVTLRLLELLHDHEMTAEQVLRKLAAELQRSDIVSIFSYGNQIITELFECEILVLSATDSTR